MVKQLVEHLLLNYLSSPPWFKMSPLAYSYILVCCLPLTENLIALDGSGLPA